MYADANIFVIATLDKGVLGQRARQLIADVRTGKIPLRTSVVTYDEVVWVVRKACSKTDAMSAGKALLEMQHLQLLSLAEEHLLLAHSLAEKYALDPRDSLHLATALAVHETEFLTEDRDFYTIPEILVKRLNDI